MKDGLRNFSRRWLERPATTGEVLLWSLGAVAVATLARFALLPVLGPSFPYVTYFPAVVLAAAFGGFRGGLIAVAAALACAWFFFLTPQGSFAVRSLGDAVSLLVFTFNVSAGAVCAALLRLAIVRVAISDRRNELLIKELNHRVNNNLTAVLSVARHTARSASSLDEFLPAFQGRVLALARSHELLATSDWSNVEVRKIVEKALAAYSHDGGEERIAVEGPSVALPAAKAVSLGMVLNELATNAARHGALADHGSVSVSWVPLDADRWRLLWIERAERTVDRPTSEGLGMRLMQRLVKGDLGGDIALEYAPSGLTAQLTFRP